MALAKHRTKREVLRLVRTIAPAPTVPNRVEPLGPEPVGIPMPGAPTWRKPVEGFATRGRELPPGDRKKDWIDRAGAAPERERSDQPAEVSARPMTDPRGEVGVPGERYRIQFTASQEYVDLLERAQELLSHAVPSRSLEDVHLRALPTGGEPREGKYGAPRPKRTEETAAPETIPTAATSGEQAPEILPRVQRSKKRARTPRRRMSRRRP